MGIKTPAAHYAALLLGGSALLLSTAGHAAECAGAGPGDTMIRVGPLCVDKYEASVWSNPDGTGTQYGVKKDDYPDGFPHNGNWSTKVYAVSKKGAIPSRYITWFQAQQACAIAGKRLLTNAEWQMAAAGTPEAESDDGKASCATSKGPVETGSRAQCVSKWGANDMGGNVGEWVANWGHSGDEPWSPTGHASTNDKMYGKDLVVEVQPSHVQEGDNKLPSAWVRGGTFHDASGAGIYAIDMSRSPTDNAAVSGTIGFRCAM